MLNLFGPLNLVSKIAGGFLIGLVLILFIALKVEQRGHAKAKVQITKLVAAREADRRAYEAAQVKAAELNKQTVQRIETQQQRITANVEADLTSRLERLRSELRKNTPAQSSAGKPGSGGVPAAPQGTDEASRVCLAPDKLLLAAENEERHDQLIRWVEEQLKVQR